MFEISTIALQIDDGLCYVPKYFTIVGFTVLTKIVSAVALMSIAGVASAGSGGNGCINLWFFEYCPPTPPSQPTRLKAPEIDPTSALAGLSLLAGGLAVLRGRRVKARA